MTGEQIAGLVGALVAFLGALTAVLRFVPTAAGGALRQAVDVLRDIHEEQKRSSAILVDLRSRIYWMSRQLANGEQPPLPPAGEELPR